MYKESRDWAHVALPVPSCSPLRPVPATVRRHAQASSTWPVHLLRTATNNNNHKNERVPLLAIMLLAQPFCSCPLRRGRGRPEKGSGDPAVCGTGKRKEALVILPMWDLFHEAVCCLSPSSWHGSLMSRSPLQGVLERCPSRHLTPLSTNPSNRHTSMPRRSRKWLARAVAGAVAFGAPLCRRCEAHEGTYT